MKDEPNPSTEQTHNRLHWSRADHVKGYPLRQMEIVKFRIRASLKIWK